MEQSENNEAQWKLEFIEECLKAMEGSDVYGMVDAYKMSLAPDLVDRKSTRLNSSHRP